MNNISNVINNIYSKRTYLDEYGGSVFMTCVILIIFFCITSYFHLMNNIDPIKADWVNQRCTPGVIPFAGLINKPKDKSAFEFTGENFTFCIQSILREISGYALLPINTFTKLLLEAFSEMREAISAIRNMLNIIREKFEEISKELFGRTLNILIPIQKMVIGLKDMMNKSHGVFTATLYTALGGYMTLKSAIGAIFELIVIILIALAALIVILWIVPFTWGAAATMTGIFAAIAVPLALVAITMNEVFNLQSSGIPSKPSHCFAENTLIKTMDGDVPIQNIKPGTILKNNSRVSAVFKLSSKDQNMYNLENVIVSGTHKVMFKFKWIQVKDHPEAKLINNFRDECIYCLNTSNKLIEINGIEFSDWDELNLNELNEIKVKTKLLPKDNFKRTFLHTYLDSGFIKGTSIVLEDGNSLPIEKVEVNHILKNGENVIGIVEIDASDINIYKYFLENKTFIAGPNIQVYDLNLGILDSYQLVKEKILTNENKLYHLLTNKSRFTIDDVTFFDYNIAIEKYLEKENSELLSSLFR